MGTMGKIEHRRMKNRKYAESRWPNLGYGPCFRATVDGFENIVRGSERMVETHGLEGCVND